jgi:hypothetical protein
MKLSLHPSLVRYLTKSIEVFPTPVHEGIMNESLSDILQSIDHKTKYLPTITGSANVVIAKDSENLAKILFQTSQSELFKLLETAAAIITDVCQSISNRGKNIIFISKIWLKTTKIFTNTADHYKEL